jgi:hypothetical protein
MSLGRNAVACGRSATGGAPARKAWPDVCFQVLTAAALVLSAPGSARACDALAAHRAEIEHHLALAEDHRGWVELWSGLDDREARLELAYFSDRLRRVIALVRGDPCRNDIEQEILAARVRHELAWSQRKEGLLRDKVKVSRALP